MPSGNPRRFVVQQHILSADQHWDLMLETEDMLATWQLSDPPKICLAGTTTVKKIADHRKAYLEYEGPVSNNRGEVHIVERGTYVLMSQTGREWVVEFSGGALRGRYRIFRPDPAADLWTIQPMAGPNLA